MSDLAATNQGFQVEPTDSRTVQVEMGSRAVSGHRRLLRASRLTGLAAGSAFLITLSFPPFDYGFLAWVGLAPLLFVLRGSSVPAAAWASIVFGALFGIGAFTWLMGLDGVTPANYLLMFLPFCLYYVSFGLLYRVLSLKSGPWILLGAPSLWVSLEYVRANLFFLSFPWNLLGHSQYRYLPFIQIASVTGVYGLSFLVVMVNQFLSEVPDLLVPCLGKRIVARQDSPPYPWLPHASAVGLALMLTVAYGYSCLTTPEEGRSLRVAVIQANVVARAGMTAREQVDHLRAYEQLTKEASLSKPELIIWPSSSLPGPIFSRLVQWHVRRIVSEARVPLLMGGAGGEKFGPRMQGYLPYSNSEFLISPSGSLEAQYNKIRLLPFNEYLPLQAYMTWPQWITTLRASFQAGSEYTLFQIAGTRFGTPICWENMFPDHFRRFVQRGAEFMVTATNEGFFGVSQAPYQTLAINVFRAVENRVSVVRTATTGISGFISPAGEILEVVKDPQGTVLFVSGFLVRDIPLVAARTFYTMYGDLFAYLAMVAVVWCVLWVMVADRAPRRSRLPQVEGRSYQ